MIEILRVSEETSEKRDAANSENRQGGEMKGGYLLAFIDFWSPTGTHNFPRPKKVSSKCDGNLLLCLRERDVDGWDGQPIPASCNNIQRNPTFLAKFKLSPSLSNNIQHHSTTPSMGGQTSATSVPKIVGICCAGMARA